MTADSQHRILAAALSLIAEQGVAGTTMSAIASRAEVARQTLYNHYPDVESVIYAATTAHQHESIEQLTQVLNTIESPSGRLEHLVRHAAAVAQHGHAPVRGGYSPQVTELLVLHDRQLQQLVATALRDGIDGNEFRSDIDVPHDSILLQRMIESVGELVAADPAATGAIVATAARAVLGAVQQPV